jgi:hypothetical protein
MENAREFKGLVFDMAAINGSKAWQAGALLMDNGIGLPGIKNAGNH